jgi:hypothetical protein
MHNIIFKTTLVYLSFFGAALIWIDLFYAVNMLICIIVLFLLFLKKSIDPFVLILTLLCYILAFLLSFSYALGNIIYDQILFLYLKSGIFVFVSIFWIRYFDLTLNNLLENEFIKILILAALLHCTLVIMLLLLPEFRSTVYSISSLYMIQKYTHVADFIRVIDPSIGGSSFGFIICAIFFAFEILLIKKQIVLNFLIRFLVRFIVLISLFVTARSGFALYMVLIVFLGIRYRSIELLTFNIFLLSIGLSGILLLDLQNMSVMVAWASETFINPLESPTVQLLMKSFALPGNLYTYTLGGSEYPGLTDSVIIKLLYGVGLPAVLVCIVFPSLVILTVCNWTTVLDKHTVTFVNVMYLILIVANLKESLWTASRGAGLLFVLFVCLFGSFAYRRLIK